MTPNNQSKLEAFLQSMTENIDDFWFVDNPNASEVHEEINKLLAIIRKQAETIEFYSQGNTDLEPKSDKKHLYDQDYPMNSNEWLQRSMSDFINGKRARQTKADIEEMLE